MKILVIVIISITIVCSIVLFLYDINLFSEDPCYDITIFSRRNYNYGWGINYKKGFEFWKFSENVYGGCAEGIIYPEYPRD